MLERIFHLKENQTTVRRELLGGLTTFMAMAYVVIVNPRISGRSGNAGGGRALRNVRVGGNRNLGDGPVGQLSDCACSRNVSQRVLHLLDRSGARRALANGAWRGLSFRQPLSDPDAYQHPRAHRQRHSRLPEARHRGRHRILHCLRGAAQRQNHCGQHSHVRGPRKIIRPSGSSGSVRI